MIFYFFVNFLFVEWSYQFCSFSSNHNIWKHNFLAMMQRPKNEWSLSAPPIAYFYQPQQIGNIFFYKMMIDVSFNQKQFEKFFWKLKVYIPHPIWVKRDKQDKFFKNLLCFGAWSSQTSSTLVFLSYYRTTGQQGIKRCPSLIWLP